MSGSESASCRRVTSVLLGGYGSVAAWGVAGLVGAKLEGMRMLSHSLSELRVCAADICASARAATMSCFALKIAPIICFWWLPQRRSISWSCKHAWCARWEERRAVWSSCCSASNWSLLRAVGLCLRWALVVCGPCCSVCARDFVLRAAVAMMTIEDTRDDRRTVGEPCSDVSVSLLRVRQCRGSTWGPDMWWVMHWLVMHDNI